MKFSVTASFEIVCSFCLIFCETFVIPHYQYSLNKFMLVLFCCVLFCLFAFFYVVEIFNAMFMLFWQKVSDTKVCFWNFDSNHGLDIKKERKQCLVWKHIIYLLFFSSAFAAGLCYVFQNGGPCVGLGQASVHCFRCYGFKLVSVMWWSEVCGSDVW